MAVKRHGDMEMEMPNGIPWLMYPLVFHSSREHTCDFNSTETCEWLYGYWRDWYKDDLRYALPTIALFMSVILVFVVGNFTQQAMPRSILQSKRMRRLTGLTRYLSYRAFRIPKLNWNSAPAGVLMLGAVGTIYFFCMTLGPKPYYWPNTATVNYGNSPAIATRSGWLSIACMPFVFATAGKSNFITAVTGISHEKLQVFHRWISYAFFVTALVHTFPFIVYHIKVGDMVMSWKTDAFYWTGVAALVPQGYLTFASFSPLRNLSYEWFKATHFLAATCFMVFFFLHCAGTLTSWDYFVVTGVLFSLSWLHRQIRIYFEHGISHKATLNLEPNGFIQVVVPTESTWRAGQHFFVRFLSLGLHAWTIHPFTACSLPERASVFEITDSELVFYIRPQNGFTGRLARYIEAHPGCTMRVLLDGPYGGIDMTKIERSQRQLVVAGGSGAGWILPLLTAYMRKLELARIDEKIGSQPSMRILLATRDVFTRDWFEEKVVNLLESFGLDKSMPGLEVELYVTGAADHGEATKTSGQFLQRLNEPEKVRDAEVHALEPQSSSVSSSGKLSNKLVHVHYYDGRPDLPTIIRQESQSTDPDKPLGVFVCGPLSMQSDVQNAVASEQVVIMKDGSKDIYLHMEHFSWA